MHYTAGILSNHNSMSGSGISTGGNVPFTAGSLHGAKLTAGSLSQAFTDAGVHPALIEHLHGSGFFSTLLNGIKAGTEFVLQNKDAITTVAKGAKAGYDMYKASKKGGALEEKNKPKRPLTTWSKLVKKITAQQKCNVSEAIKYIKANNLY
jgi:hypothetical protein